MNKDILPPVQTEQINTSEEFLNRLYDKTIEWLEERGGKVIKEFGPQKIENWEKSGDYHKGTSFIPIDLLRACVVEDPRKVFLLTLGRGWRSRQGYTDGWRFQFGFLPGSIEAVQTTEELGIEVIKTLLSQGKFGTHGYGEISAELRSKKIDIDCWVDRSLFGGKEIDNWPSERILTNQGLEEALNIIKETVQRAFREDLT